VLLHGYDATPHDIAALGPLVDPAAHWLVVAPEGPVLPPDGTGRAWFQTGPRGPDPDSFHATFEALHAEVDRLCATHLMGRVEVVVGGFSQGGAMALALAFGRGDRPVPTGVLCLSGFLADVDGLDYDWNSASGTPVLLQHGRADEVVPVDLGADTAAVLEHHGVVVTHLEYDMGHQTTLESLTDAREWLAGLV
jgi:phospholipase/carboxylesterase